jgi:hypothetical protein
MGESGAETGRGSGVADKLELAYVLAHPGHLCMEVGGVGEGAVGQLCW